MGEPFKFVVEEAKNGFNEKVEKVLQGLTTKEAKRKLRVACSRTPVFSGHHTKRVIDEITFLEVLEKYLKPRKKKKHKKSVEELIIYRYLAQVDINSFPNSFSALFPSFNAIKSSAKHHFYRENLRVQNLWMNLSDSSVSSTWHYDTNSNFLLVCSGKKSVQVISPAAGTRCFQLTKVGELSANFPLEINNSAIASVAKGFELTPGDVLFIPEGWWHTVDSTVQSCAVNYWFPGIADSEDVFKGSSASFYIRSGLEHMIQKKISAETVRLRSNVDQNFFDTFKEKYPDISPAEAALFSILVEEDEETNKKYENFLLENKENFTKKIQGFRKECKLMVLKELGIL
eukprot:snap_masked-scaffold_12-processed-gene-5.68-mRNA-1 protein AED:1.00 eAED:1.00 QI:0/0/0/0/1/1/2/0/343